MMSTEEATDSKPLNYGGTGKQTVTTSYYTPHQIDAQDMAVDTKNIYRNYNEVVDAVRDGSFAPGRTTCWKNGRLYFLCTKDGRGNHT